MGNYHTTKMKPMEVKKNLKLINNYNYSFRKFHLQTDKYGHVEPVMPTNPSVANLLFDDKDFDKAQNS